jgi:DNA recombination protein RmuC
MGFRALALQKRSGEVWKVLGAVRFEFAKHGEVVEKLKKQLGAAANTIDALDTRTNVMNRRLKDVEMLPAAEAQDLLGLPGPNENEKA